MVFRGLVLISLLLRLAGCSSEGNGIHRISESAVYIEKQACVINAGPNILQDAKRCAELHNSL